MIGVLPTLALVRGHDGPVPIMDLATADAGHDLRLDQIGALYDIVHRAQRGQPFSRRRPRTSGRRVDVATTFWRTAAHRWSGGAIGWSGTDSHPNANALAYCAGLVGVALTRALRWSDLG